MQVTVSQLLQLIRLVGLGSATLQLGPDLGGVCVDAAPVVQHKRIRWQELDRAQGFAKVHPAVTVNSLGAGAS